MQRAAIIVTQLETCLAAAPEALARRLGVGVRTIATEVATINQSMGRAASIRLTDGRYRLLVVDADGFAKVRDQITGAGDSFNDPECREAFILAKLARAIDPVRTEDLALQMSVGRSTVTGDVAHLREQLEDSGVRIEGRTHVGLQLRGPELAIRTVLLRHAYRPAYDTFLMGAELDAAFNDTADEFQLDEDLRANILRWFTVMLDRILSDHPLTGLPDTYADLAGTPAYSFARALADRVSPLIGEVLPANEVLFLAIPAAGRRTPTNADVLSGLGAPVSVEALMRRIFERVLETMSVDVEPSDLKVEFSHHLGFMINRMRYSLHVDKSVDDLELRERFPVAFRMAEIAREVIAEDTGLIMDEIELSLAATYFQVFLEDHAASRQRTFRVAILTRQGPGAARLIRGQLAKVLPADTSYTILASTEMARPDDTDLLVTTPGSKVNLGIPTLELSEVFDRSELLRKLSAMRFAHHGPLALTGESGSLLVSLLDEERFVQLPVDCGYAEAAEILVERLEQLGMVDHAFREALEERQSKAPMLINESVAFPHATAHGLQGVACALGVIARGDKEEGLRLVLLMAVPHKDMYDDTLLIRVYDEVIRLSQNAALVRKISRLSTYVQLFYLMEGYSETTTQGRS